MIHADMEDKYGEKRTQLAVVAGFVGNGELVFTAAIGPVDDEKGKKYSQIAWSKFDVSSRTGLPTRHVRACDLVPGDTIFYGSVVLDGIVVAASGCYPEDDELYASWFAAALRAEAEREMRALQENDEIWVPE